MRKAIKLRDEAIDLFNSLVQSPIGKIKQNNLFNLKDTILGVVKFWLDSFEEKNTSSSFKKLRRFFGGVEISNKNRGRNRSFEKKNKKLFYMGA